MVCVRVCCFNCREAGSRDLLGRAARAARTARVPANHHTHNSLLATILNPTKKTKPQKGCEPVDILLAKRDGRFSGEAFVVLGSPLQIQMAVDKNKSYMGRRYVEVFRAKKLVR